MDTLFIPNENDFRRWIREAMKECLETMPIKTVGPDAKPEEEPLLTRKEVAYIFRISLVTLHEWMKQGLPSHKQGGRVYFLRSEVMGYIKQKNRHPFLEPRLDNNTGK
jgi:hypothetical protein